MDTANELNSSTEVNVEINDNDLVTNIEEDLSNGSQVISEVTEEVSASNEEVLEEDFSYATMVISEVTEEVSSSRKNYW